MKEGATFLEDSIAIARIYLALAGSLDRQVGPWKAYLGILLRRDGTS